MSENIVSQLATARKLFSEISTDDSKVLSDYGWTFVKAILQNLSEIDSVTARQLLADCIKLPLPRPSKFHSALLAAAVKVAQTYPEFHFATFLKMWGLENLRPEDKINQKSADGKVFLSLEERAIKTLAHSLLIHPEDRQLLQTSGFGALLSSHGLSILPMLVTRIKQAVARDGRKYTFVTLASVEGMEIESISHSLQPSPLHPLPDGKRHYVNIGQLYDVLVRSKVPVPLQASVPDASSSALSATVPNHAPVPEAYASSSKPTFTLLSSYLSTQRPSDIFPTEIGYIEHIDTEHSHMHVYDCHSRHFVAPVQRFSREKEGDFVRFIPIVPQASKFKTAILVATVPSSSEEVKNILRGIRITSINKEKGYAAWELLNKEEPITELLSPLQLSQGETSPTFTSGYLNLASVTLATSLDPEALSTVPATSTTVPDASASASSAPIREGWQGSALIYLKRGKDKQKRPYVAKIF